MRFLSFAKLLALLLLISYSVAAETGGTTNEFQKKQHLNLNKAAGSLPKNMLQPQVVHVNSVPEHSVKPITSGFGILFLDYNPQLVLQPKTPSNAILQDANRCESVSRFLFPYHFFW